MRRIIVGMVIASVAWMIGTQFVDALWMKVIATASAFVAGVILENFKETMRVFKENCQEFVGGWDEMRNYWRKYFANKENYIINWKSVFWTVGQCMGFLLFFAIWWVCCGYVSPVPEAKFMFYALEVGGFFSVMGSTINEPQYRIPFLLCFTPPGVFLLACLTILMLLACIIMLICMYCVVVPWLLYEAFLFCKGVVMIPCVR